MRVPHLALILKSIVELVKLIREVCLQHACSINIIAADPLLLQGSIREPSQKHGGG